jgi:hypothetical protein
MLFFQDGTPFAIAFSSYAYRPVEESDKSPRIFIQVEIEGFQTEAFLDTGSPYVICDPIIAENLSLDLTHGEKIEKFIIRGNTIEGYLHRMNITILAEEGQGLPVDATVFVPNLSSQDWGNFPSIIGLSGFLERIRFAIDPLEDRFYFGRIDNQ